VHRRRRAEPQGQLTPQMRVLLVCDASIVGLGYAFGPDQWHSSPTLSIIADLGLPYEMWGALYLIGAVVLAISRTQRQLVTAHGYLSLVYTVWGLCALLPITYGMLDALGDPTHVLAVAGVHLIALWRARRAELALRAGR
jgi:hypothetical protein